MKKLKDAQVGDQVVLQDINRKQPTYDVITAVGRKYVTVGRSQFVRETGHWSNRNYSTHLLCYTPDEWEAKGRSAVVMQGFRKIGEVGQMFRMPAMSDQDLRKVEKLVDQLLELLGEKDDPAD